MERPYVICHILSALNGRISGPFMSTPAAYRRYLKRKGISYIQAGEDCLDCGIALEKLFRLFGICKLLVCGGGMIDGRPDALPLLTAPPVLLPKNPESGRIIGSGNSVGPRRSTGADTTPKPRTRGPEADSYAKADDEKVATMSATPATLG